MVKEGRAFPENLPSPQQYKKPASHKQNDWRVINNKRLYSGYLAKLIWFWGEAQSAFLNHQKKLRIQAPKATTFLA